MTKKEATVLLKNARLLVHIGEPWIKRIRYYLPGGNDPRGGPLTKTKAVEIVVSSSEVFRWSYSGNTLNFWLPKKKDSKQRCNSEPEPHPCSRRGGVH